MILMMSVSYNNVNFVIYGNRKRLACLHGKQVLKLAPKTKLKVVH